MQDKGINFIFEVLFGQAPTVTYIY